MKGKHLIVTLLLVFVFFSCKKSEKEQILDRIENLENEIYKDNTASFNKKQAYTLIDSYKEFSEKYPKETKTPYFLFKAGELSMTMNLGSQAVVFFNQIENKYPEHQKYPLSIFYQAFVFENNLNNLKKAKEYYELFLKKYPKHELADDAEMSLKNLGKSPEEIIRSFEEKNKESLDTLS